MNTIRTSAVALLITASLCGCSTVYNGVSSTASLITRPFHRTPPPPAAPSSPSLDAYKMQVAHQLMQRNPDLVFSGRLPDILPAIVVLSVTVDRDGVLKNVEVQRSRDADASKVAVDAVWRSGPLPKPGNLVTSGNAVTFSETFLFDERYRFQLRSVAGPQ